MDERSGAMILQRSIILLAILFLFFPTSTAAEGTLDEAGWEVIVPGIDYQKFTLPDPNNVFVVRMDRGNKNLTIESSIAGGKLAEDTETVSGMYYRYDQALNYWGGSTISPTWGMTNQVVVAINGSYFDGSTGVPWGGLIHSGWYSKRYQDNGGWSGFAWKLDGTAFIGECVFHRPEKQNILYPSTGVIQQFDDLNQIRGENEVIIFTPQYKSRTGTDNTGVEVMVELTRPSMILPEPAYASGIVREIYPNEGNNLIPFNSVILSATGSKAEVLLDNIQVGDEVQISQEITSCPTYDPISWTKTYASVQGAFYFLKNGQIQDFEDPGATSHQPRTAIAFTDQYIFFVVVDGRDSLHSFGMTIHDLAMFARDSLGAIYGVAQDGGGSSTMVINGHIVNNPYCNHFSCKGEYTKSYLPFVIENGHREEAYSLTQSTEFGSAPGFERPVANGMLMIFAQQAEKSSTFISGDVVITIIETRVRLGPGTNYGEFITLPAGTQGLIAEQMNNLEGIFAKSSYWWFVDFGGVKGWVCEEDLIHNEAMGESPIAK